MTGSSGSTGTYSTGPAGTTIMSTMPSTSYNERPSSTIMTSTMNEIHTNIPDRAPTSQSTLTTNMGTSMMHTGGTNPPYAERPNTITTGGTMTTLNEYTNTMDGNRHPTTERLPTTDHYPTMEGGGGGSGGGTTITDYTSTMHGGSGTWTSTGSHGNTDVHTNEITRPTYTPGYDDHRQTPGYQYPYPPQYDNKYNYYQDIYPTYSYPMLYDHTYPMPNAPGYAHNAPSSSYGPPNDYFSSTRPREPSPVYGIPTSGTRPGTTGTTDGSTYMGNGYSNADEIKNQRKPTMPSQDGYLTSKQPEGKYNTTTSTPSTPPVVPYIRTYFNPDDYFPNSKRE